MSNYYWKVDAPPILHFAHGGSAAVKYDISIASVHIGKRQAAGLWCNNCDRSFCLSGGQYVHCTPRDAWSDQCPECGAVKGDGCVDYAFSFCWAQNQRHVMAAAMRNWDKHIAEDENGTLFTGAELLKQIAAEINFDSSLGKEFE